MLAAPKRLTTPALIPFVPRQVMLENHRIAAAEKEDKKRRKAKEMEKKDKKKSKKRTKSSETLDDCSGDAETLALDRPNGGDLPREGKGREILLSSIAGFLESNGFAKTLAVFRSEAQLENDGRTTSFVNLEDLFCKFLDSSKTHTHARIDMPKEKDLEKCGISTKDESEDIHHASEHINRKKRKHKNRPDDDETKAKEKEMSLSAPDGFSSGNTEVFGDKNLIDKEKKKKKYKMSSDACDDNIVCGDHRKFQEIVEEKIEELKSLTNNSSTLSADSNAKHKGEKKKKKRDKSTSENLDAVSSDQLDQETSQDVRKESAKEDLKKSDFGKENVAVSEENVDNFEKKSYKKRKRSTSEESVPRAENETITKESKHVNLEGAEDNKETGTILGKKRKTGKSNEYPTQTFKTSPSEQNPSAQDLLKESEGHKLANGNLEKNEKEKGASSKGKKKEKLSAEPKTVNAFQRVKVDQVKFADERLQDNSYWAMDDTGSRYGAKAQEVLGQVRGRDFRHEKTKKKRGSYRGGQIDLQTHSIKFNDSDDE